MYSKRIGETELGDSDNFRRGQHNSAQSVLLNSISCYEVSVERHGGFLRKSCFHAEVVAGAL
ncbi:hypothetical protein D3C85_1918310 [compost metagenome]